MNTLTTNLICQDLSLKLGFLLSAIHREYIKGIDHDKACLRDLLFQVPDINNEIWRYLVEETEKRESTTKTKASDCLESYIKFLDSKNSWHQSLYHLGSIASADGPVCDKFSSLLDNLSRRSLPQDPSEWAILLEELIQRRLKVVVETGADEFLHTLRNRDTPLIVSNFRSQEPAVSKLRLATVFIARTLKHCPENEHPSAINRAQNALLRYWNIHGERLKRVEQWVKEPGIDKYDSIRISRILYSQSDESEREHLLDILFQTAETVESLSEPLLKELLGCTADLRLSHLHFQRALEREKDRWYNALSNSGLLEHTGV